MMWIGHEWGVINGIGERNHKIPFVLFFFFSLRYFSEIVDRLMDKS